MEITAIIVARKGSVRIKNKSMLKLGNDTLISNKIKQLKKCKNINRIVFGSDSDEMLEHAKSYGAETVKRPEYFCDEKLASANDMIGNMLDLIKTDLTNLNKGYDSLLSVVEFQEHLWNENKKPLNYNPYQERHVPARELPKYYMQDGGIFIQPYKQMKDNSYFFGKKPYLYVIPHSEFLDINTERDYIVAKCLYKYMKYDI